MKIQKSLIITTSYFTIGSLGLYVSLYQFTILSFSQLFGLNSAMMGLFIALQHIAISLPPLILGLLSAKIGKKKVITVSYGLIIVGTFLIGALNNVFSFMVAIFAVGAGFSVLEATHSAALADEFPEESNKHMNFSQVCFSLGALSSPFIAEWLISSGVYFKDLYIYISIIFFIQAAAFLFVRYGNDKGKQEPVKNIFSAFHHLKKKTFLLLALAIFAYVGVENTIAAFTDSYYELTLEQPHLSALALSLFWGAMIPSRFLAGVIKVDGKKMFVFMSSLTVVSIMGAMLVPDNTIKLIMFALSGFACGPLWPFIMDTTAAKFKGASASPLNIMMSFSGLGGAALPFVAGIMVTYTSETAAYYLAAVMTVLMTGFYLASVNNKKSTEKQYNNQLIK